MSLSVEVTENEELLPEIKKSSDSCEVLWRSIRVHHLTSTIN